MRLHKMTKTITTTAKTRTIALAASGAVLATFIAAHPAAQHTAVAARGGLIGTNHNELLGL
jgi:hypothetical protein